MAVATAAKGSLDAAGRRASCRACATQPPAGSSTFPSVKGSVRAARRPASRSVVAMPSWDQKKLRDCCGGLNLTVGPHTSRIIHLCFER